MSIPLAFFILSALLLWLIIGVKGRWGVKAFVISLVLYSCLSIDFSLENLMGWPSDQSLPKEFHVHWVKIKEPNKKTSEKGYIYVWATDLNRSISKQGWQGWKGYFISFQSYDPTEPRAYRLDYSKDRHEQALGLRPLHILRLVELSLARNVILGGINQTIMMALSMVVIASMIGVRGLGSQVMNSIGNGYLGLGVISGLSIVALAIIMDRAIQSHNKRYDKWRDFQ